MTTETPARTLSRQQLIDLYRLMLLTREVDNRVRILYRQGKVTGGVYSQLGHEAISVGSASALRPTDILAPMHRDLGAHLVRGMDLRQILAQLLARDNVYTGGRDNALHIGDQHLRVIPQISHLGVSIPVAAGAALAARQRGEDSVALTYVGDGAINTGDFHEGLNFAAALRLPFILIIENNQFAYSTPLSQQTALDQLVRRASGYGVPGVRVDGNDVVAVYEAVAAAAERARVGDGPTLIEAVTMRMRGHSENDNASYVPKELLEEWGARDPIERMERQLLDEGMMSPDDAARLKAEIAAEVSQAADWAEAQPLPEPESAVAGVYAEGE
ncbi:MAG TPA: thiamine pyrophosphate-dependent dehydrogenase E1 component subunit alpha [Chloroflexota bacterium]|nr:thiamine pyrophosphate-dependent dehydrogenase E1 component subunit alpha [Chloroflexota bacterium]